MSMLDEYMLQNSPDSPIYQNIDPEELEELEILQAEDKWEELRNEKAFGE